MDEAVHADHPVTEADLRDHIDAALRKSGISYFLIQPGIQASTQVRFLTHEFESHHDHFISDFFEIVNSTIPDTEWKIADLGFLYEQLHLLQAAIAFVRLLLDSSNQNNIPLNLVEPREAARLLQRTDIAGAPGHAGSRPGALQGHPAAESSLVPYAALFLFHYYESLFVGLYRNVFMHYSIVSMLVTVISRVLQRHRTQNLAS